MNEQPHKRWWQRRWVKAVVSLIVLGCIALFAVGEYILHNAAPILRKRVIQTLSDRFDAPVELDSLDISLVKGVEVSGSGLRVPYRGNRPMNATSPQVLIGIDHFTFRSTLKGIFHSPTSIGVVYVDTVTLDVPVGEGPETILGPKEHDGSADPQHPKTVPKIALIVDQIRCKNVALVLEVKDPAKEPHRFDIQHLVLDKTPGMLSYNYNARLINPIPKGEIDAHGHIGPWNTSDARQTPVDGDYTFTDADLNTIRGLGGTLNSTGHFDGVLEHLTVDGTADVPDFSLDISNHPLPLHTKFHAYVDATTGDTTLDPVLGRLRNSDIQCKGIIANLKGKGHDIALDVLVPNGRMEDVLELGMKSPKPIMHARLSLKAKLHIPPGKVRVAAKLELAGQVHVQSLIFTNQSVLDRLDGLSMRAQGRPEGVAIATTDHQPEVQSALTTNFTLAHGSMTFKDVRYQLPGALILLDGAYSMEGDMYEFKGHVRTDAKASQMVTGWKAKLLKPLDPFLSRNGAGVELPISITGQKNDVHFGLAFKSAQETPEQMKADIKQKREKPAPAPR